MYVEQVTPMDIGNLTVPMGDVQALCQEWKLAEFSLFGSVLRSDFGPESDVDVLVTFAPGAAMTFEGFIEMREELSTMFGGREVDLVEKRLVRNPFRRHEILTTRKVVYPIAEDRCHNRDSIQSEFPINLASVGHNPNIQ